VTLIIDFNELNFFIFFFIVINVLCVCIINNKNKNNNNNSRVSQFLWCSFLFIFEYCRAFNVFYINQWLILHMNMLITIPLINLYRLFFLITATIGTLIFQLLHRFSCFFFEYLFHNCLNIKHFWTYQNSNKTCVIHILQIIAIKLTLFAVIKRKKTLQSPQK